MDKYRNTAYCFQATCARRDSEIELRTHQLDRCGFYLRFVCSSLTFARRKVQFSCLNVAKQPLIQQVISVTFRMLEVFLANRVEERYTDISTVHFE